MRRAARAIVIHDGKLLIMHRNKFGTEYDTLPGGAVEIGEQPAQTVLRELLEETSIQAKDPRLIFIDHAGDMYGDQYVFYCDYIAGEPALHPDTHEHAINKMGKNLYEPKWLPLEKLKDSPFVSEELKAALLEVLETDWPTEVKEFNSSR